MHVRGIALQLVDAVSQPSSLARGRDTGGTTMFCLDLRSPSPARKAAALLYTSSAQQHRCFMEGPSTTAQKMLSASWRWDALRSSFSKVKNSVRRVKTPMRLSLSKSGTVVSLKRDNVLVIASNQDPK